MVSGQKKTEREHRAEGEMQSLMWMKFQVYKMRKFWRLCSTVNIASTLGLYT